jgi:hypothetical protein
LEEIPFDPMARGGSLRVGAEGRWNAMGNFGAFYTLIM